MRLLQLSQEPLESVRLTVRKTFKVWIGKFRMQAPNSPNSAMSTVFAPVELVHGDAIEINGLRQAMYHDSQCGWLAVRLYGMAFNGDRYLNDKPHPTPTERADVWRIAPFERSVANELLEIGRVFHGKAIETGRTTLLPAHMSNTMIERADLLPTLYAPLEWQLSAKPEQLC